MGILGSNKELRKTSTQATQLWPMGLVASKTHKVMAGMGLNCKITCHFIDLLNWKPRYGAFGGGL